MSEVGPPTQRVGAGPLSSASCLPAFSFDFVRGFAMGSADIVPGVSGGTIALLLGIYERLIASVRAGSRALGSLLVPIRVGFRRWLGSV